MMKMNLDEIKNEVLRYIAQGSRQGRPAIDNNASTESMLEEIYIHLEGLGVARDDTKRALNALASPKDEGDPLILIWDMPIIGVREVDELVTVTQSLPSPRETKVSLEERGYVLALENAPARGGSILPPSAITGWPSNWVWEDDTSTLLIEGESLTVRNVGDGAGLAIFRHIISGLKKDRPIFYTSDMAKVCGKGSREVQDALRSIGKKFLKHYVYLKASSNRAKGGYRYFDSQP